MLAREMDQTSLYLHVPFCRHRCSYCDFNTFAGQERMIPAYVNGICQEIVQVSAGVPERIPAHTIFFGGGTPSLLSVEQFRQILATIRERFDLATDAEITLEANPGTVNLAYLQGLRQVGFNRLSYGMQSAHPDDLRLLERQHDFFDVAQAVRWSRIAGFDNLSLDLIFALPGQSLERWRETVERACGLEPDHLSLYALTIEHGTPLEKRWSRGMIPLVDDDLAADMYELAMDQLPQDGYEQYEISNWARRWPDGRLRSCRHNLQYWYNLPYLGFGPGAHGYAGGARTMNVGGIRPFVERCQKGEPASFPAGPATRRVIPVDRFTEMQETMMVGLRLTQEGVAARAFQERFGEPLEAVFGKEIRRLLKTGLLEWVEEAVGADDGLERTGRSEWNSAVGGTESAAAVTKNARLRLTRRGRMLGNQVFMQFVG